MSLDGKIYFKCQNRGNCYIEFFPIVKVEHLEWKVLGYIILEIF